MPEGLSPQELAMAAGDYFARFAWEKPVADAEMPAAAFLDAL